MATLLRSSHLHRRRLSSLLHRSSTTLATQSSTQTPSPTTTTPPILPYDHLAAAAIAKIRRLSSPNPQFLRHSSPHPSPTSYTFPSPQTRQTTLPNGLRVASQSALASPTATVTVSIDAGSRYETDSTCGTAHFLKNVIQGNKFAEEVENIGGRLDSYSTREQTVYSARVLGKDVGRAVEILAAGLLDSGFDGEGIERVRKEILGKLNEVSGQSEEVIFDHLHATAFQYSPLGRTVLGSAENIKEITKEHLLDYISTHYTAPRMVISASGAVKHEDLVEQVKKLFPNLSADPTTSSQLVAKEPAAFTGSEVRIIDDDMPLAQFAVAFSGASWTDPDSIALMVMQTMLGSWNNTSGGGKHMGSQLVQRVAIDDLAESITAFNTHYKDIGLFGVHAVAKPDCLDDLAWAIMNEISQLSYRVSEADVTRACNQLKSSLQLHIDGTSHIAEDIGRQLLTYGRRIPVPELFARIDAVDASTVRRVANRFLFDQDIAIAASGPIQGLPDYNWFRRRTYLLRY